MSKPITVAIAGQGRSGYGIHADTMRKLPELFEIVAVMDADPERAQEASAEIGCRGYHNFDDLVNDDAAELLVVATPNKLHVEHSLAALNKGRHVVCEKPVGFKADDVDQLIAAAEQQQRVFAPFQNQRFDPSFQKMLEIIESGRLGKIVLVKLNRHGFKRRWDWQTLLEFGGGELNNNGPHVVDHAMAFFGEGDYELLCDMRRTLSSGDAEDHIKIVLKGADNPTVDIELSNCCAFDVPGYMIAGTSGSLISDGGGLKWKWVDWSAMPERPVVREPTPDRSYNSEKLEWQEASWQPPAGAEGDTRTLFYRALHATLRDGAELVVTPQSVRRRMELIDRCHQAAPLPEAQTV